MQQVFRLGPWRGRREHRLPRHRGPAVGVLGEDVVEDRRARAGHADDEHRLHDLLLGDGRVVVQDQAIAIRGGPEQGARQGQPLLGRVGAKACGDVPQVVCGLLLGGKAQGPAKVFANAHHGGVVQLGAHIVDHELAQLHARDFWRQR